MSLRAIAAAALCFLLPACAARDTVAEGGTAVGTVAVVGNMPFTRLAIRVDGATTYLLRCTPELDDSLRTMQGRLVRVRFTAARESPEGTSLEVVHAEAVESVEHR